MFMLIEHMIQLPQENSIPGIACIFESQLFDYCLRSIRINMVTLKNAYLSLNAGMCAYHEL